MARKTVGREAPAKPDVASRIRELDREVGQLVAQARRAAQAPEALDLGDAIRNRADRIETWLEETRKRQQDIGQLQGLIQLLGETGRGTPEASAGATAATQRAAGIPPGRKAGEPTGGEAGATGTAKLSM